MVLNSIKAEIIKGNKELLLFKGLNEKVLSEKTKLEELSKQNKEMVKIVEELPKLSQVKFWCNAQNILNL